MENVITAEEFVENKYPFFEDLDSGNIWVNIDNLMIEFAKLHVEAALKAASEKAMVEAEPEIGRITVKKEIEISEFDTLKFNYVFGVDQKSILNAYPLTNIK